MKTGSTQLSLSCLKQLERNLLLSTTFVFKYMSKVLRRLKVSFIRQDIVVVVTIIIPTKETNLTTTMQCGYYSITLNFNPLAPFVSISLDVRFVCLHLKTTLRQNKTPKIKYFIYGVNSFHIQVLRVRGEYRYAKSSISFPRI